MATDNLELKSFSMPATVTLQKGTNGQDGDWIIEGLASSADLDKQNEIVISKGLDLSYLQEGRGTFNWNHRGDTDPGAIVGIVTESHLTSDNGLFVRGKLLKSLPKAHDVRNLMNAFAEDAPDRKLGMSIEGKVLQRNGNQIVKAWIKAIALTADPVNTKTWVSFAKSMSACTWAPESDPLTQLDPTILEETFMKALSAAPGEALIKELTTTSDGGGTVRGTSPLMEEDLEKNPKDTGLMGSKPDKKHKGHHGKEKIRKSYTHDEALDVVKSWCPTVSDAVVNKIVDFTFARLNQED